MKVILKYLVFIFPLLLDIGNTKQLVQQFINDFYIRVVIPLNKVQK